MSGVAYYRPEDHIGVWRRLLIDVVDTTIAFLASLVLMAVLVAVFPRDIAYSFTFIGALAIWALYFVALKGSRFRTLGYVLAGARIVNLHGQRPSRTMLALRLAFVTLGPGNFLLDLLWVSSDPSRQALRDKLANTQVIRKSAVPSAGRIVYRLYTFGWTLLCAEVEPYA